MWSFTDPDPSCSGHCQREPQHFCLAEDGGLESCKFFQLLIRSWAQTAWPSAHIHSFFHHQCSIRLRWRSSVKSKSQKYYTHILHFGILCKTHNLTLHGNVLNQNYKWLYLWPNWKAIKIYISPCWHSFQKSLKKWWCHFSYCYDQYFKQWTVQFRHAVIIITWANLFQFVSVLKCRGTTLKMYFLLVRQDNGLTTQRSRVSVLARLVEDCSMSILHVFPICMDFHQLLWFPPKAPKVSLGWSHGVLSQSSSGPTLEGWPILYAFLCFMKNKVHIL